MEVDAPTNRFKHQSYNETLKQVHLPSALSQTEFKHDIRENGSQFYETLEHWKQLNLAPAFLQYAQKVGPLSASMPLLLHNWREVIELWLNALSSSDDEGLKPLLDLLQKLAHDLRTTLSPMYPGLLEALLKLLRRSISAPSLAALLATLSALFKYLLVPSIQTDLLETTWILVATNLRLCLPEVQRAVAEVWGSLLRRLKVTARDKAVQVLANNLEGVEDASAWCIVFACKSVSQTLHTSTVSLLSPLITIYLSTPSPDSLYNLIRRVLTSFIHHVKNAEQFAPVSDYLSSVLMETIRSSVTSEEPERLRRCIEILSIPCAVRQGTRLSGKHLASIASEVAHNVAVVPYLHRPLLKISTSILLASDMSLWLSHGRKMLDNSWTDPIYAMQLHGALAELNWGGWKSLALPTVLKSTPVLLETTPSEALYFLANLHRDRKLGEVDLVWRQRLDNWVNQRLEHWDASEKAVLELESALALTSYLPSLCPRLMDIIRMTLAKPVEDEEVPQITSSSRVIGLALEGLSKRDFDEWREFDLVACAQTCLSRWPQSETVLRGLGDLWSARRVLILGTTRLGSSPSLALEDIYPQLKSCIISHSRALRLGALRLLASGFVQTRHEQKDVLKRCLQGEEVSLDLQGVRERVLRIGRIGQVVKDDDGLLADICIRWLTSQLKVNLRPLWSPAAGALSSLADRLGDHVWKVVFEELVSVSDTQSTSALGTPQDDEPLDEDDPWEEERSWRDPAAHKLRGIVSQWSVKERQRSEVLKSIHTSTGRLDRRSYELQLLACLSECPRLAEKHNRELVPHFLSYVSVSHPGSSKPSRTTLTAWLTLFSKFSNPKALYSTDSLQSIYATLLSHPDRTLQTLAFSCILTYKSPHLLTHQEEINSLLDVTRWRDALTSLDLTSLDGPDRGEVVDVIIRLLFGIMLEKRGRTRGADRRAAILSTFAACTDQELSLLVELMLCPTSASSLLATHRQQGGLDAMPEKHQLGFLTLLGDVLRNLGSRLLDHWPVLLRETIQITKSAHKRLSSHVQDVGNAEGDDAEEDVEDDENDVEAEDSHTTSKNTRSIRQLGLKRLTEFFRQPVLFDFNSVICDAYEAFISPRIDHLDQENIQAPSALLELFSAWTLRPEYAPFLTSLDSRLLPKIYGCLVAKNVKPSVITKILDMVERLLGFASVDVTIAESVVMPHISLLLDNLAELSGRTSDTKAMVTPLGQRQVAILSQLAPHCQDSTLASKLLRLFIPFLRRPAKVVPDKVKADLLVIVYNAIPLIPTLADPTDPLYVKTYDVLSLLFQKLRSRPGRLALLQAFHRLATVDTTIQDVANLLAGLNAYSVKRVEEPDYDRRLEAYGTLNESAYLVLSPRQWLPLLYNSLYFIQDPAELAIRSNSAYALRRFIDRISIGEANNEFRATFLRTLYPGLKNGLRSKTELVRTELLGVLTYAVEHCSDITTLQEMQVLLAGGDQEANFFNNIHHVQFHRRSRALRRLAEVCEAGNLRSSTIQDIFIPLISFYVTSTSSVDHHLVNDALLCTGRMAGQLAWGAYYALVQKYLKLIGDKDEAEKVYVRALVAILENFHFPMEEVVEQATDDAVESDGEDDDDESPPSQMSSTKVADAVQSRLLPKLLSHLEKRDPTTEDGSRIPVALGIVKVAQYLPQATKEPQVTRLLTVLSQILRSRSQDTRDLTRDTINRIAISLGPGYLPLIFRELRAALLRGPQLHVLAYSAHALLVRVTSDDHSSEFPVLDDCVPDVAHISAEVVFGESGKDVQSEDFKTKMREVRSSSAKGLDAFMLLAKHITPSAISKLLAPLRSIMQETESLKTMNLVDEVLKRIVSGLNANSHVVPTELLVLCHTLITQNAEFLKQVPVKRRQQSKDAAIVQTKRQQDLESDHFARNAHRFVAFGLDLFNTSLKRGRFDFKDSAIMSRLNGMIVVVGNTLYSTETSVLVLGLKCVAGLVRCPSKSLEDSLPVFIHQILDIIRRAGSTEPEIVQVAFKTLATALRDGPTGVRVQEKDLVYLLELLIPDLEEPTRQASVFAMLRAIVARRFVVAEIYDAMDKVSEIMVTSQSPQVQELCRSVLLQFLLDYPQGKGRLRNQMAFLTKNLSYVHESGRKSVMELLGALINKFDERLVIEYADLLFVSLVMVIANDDSPKCREMAAQLVKNLILRLDDERREVLMSHLHAWASQRDQEQLIRVSLQVYGIVVDTLQESIEPRVQSILADITESLKYSAAQHEAAQSESEMDVDLDWQVSYYSLTLLEKVLRIFPAYTLDGVRVPWPTVVSLLLFPHAWVRTASCRLLGLLFNTVPVQRPSTSQPISVFSITGSKNAAEKMSIQLKSEHLDEKLSLQIVKNLFYLGKCFAAVPLPEANESDADADDVAPSGSSPLPWLFSRLSYQIKSAHIARRNRSSAQENWTQQPLAILKWFAAMASYLDAPLLERFLVHILTPLHRIQDDDTLRDEKMEELKVVASELQDLLQSKVGVTKFSAVYQQIRQGTLDIRRDRKAARAVQAAVNPQLSAKRKAHHNSLKKESRKRKTQGFSERKGKMKRRRED